MWMENQLPTEQTPAVVSGRPGVSLYANASRIIETEMWMEIQSVDGNSDMWNEIQKMWIEIQLPTE